MIGGLAAAEVLDDAGDNPSGLKHRICLSCHPEVPPVGTPLIRWCGAVVTVKRCGGTLVPRGTTPVGACVVCANLSACAVCGGALERCVICQATIRPSDGGLCDDHKYDEQIS